MVSPSDWGPMAWTLLHGIAERVGQQRIASIGRDEQNELRLTLRTFGALLPCQKCQVHYSEWIKHNPPDLILKKPYYELQDLTRDWIFRLHENVNMGRDITSGVTVDMLLTRYSGVNLRAAAAHLKTYYAKGIELRVLKPDDWKDAWKHLDLLLRFLS